MAGKLGGGTTSALLAFPNDRDDFVEERLSKAGTLPVIHGLGALQIGKGAEKVPGTIPSPIGIPPKDTWIPKRNHAQGWEEELMVRLQRGAYRLWLR
jgi:hypothetical protein